MKKYIVNKSFWVRQDSKVNWDASTQGREGIGIPICLLQSNNELLILIKNRRMVYKVDCKKILNHDKEWNTIKTAPHSLPTRFVCFPVSLMEFVKQYPSEKKQIQKKEIIKKDNKQLVFNF